MTLDLKIYLDTIPKAQVTINNKTEIGLNINNFYISRHWRKWRQHTKWEEIFINYVSVEELISKIYIQLPQLRDNPLKNGPKNLDISPKTEWQISTWHLLSQGNANKKKHTIVKELAPMQKSLAIAIAGGNVKWYHCCYRKCFGSSWRS